MSRETELTLLVICIRHKLCYFRMKKTLQFWTGVVVTYEQCPTLPRFAHDVEDLDHFTIHLAGWMKCELEELRRRARVWRSLRVSSHTFGADEVIYFSVPHNERAPPAKTTTLYLWPGALTF